MTAKIHDYLAVAISIAARHYKPLLAQFHDDVLQELRLLAWEAESQHYITLKKKGKRKKYGNGRSGGLKSFTRAVNARMYQFRKHYSSSEAYGTSGIE